MKRLLASLCLTALAFGTLQLPALADFSIDFDRYDHNHDHRLNYNEFQQVNQYYYHHHPTEVVISERKLHHDFDRLDSNHDGYVNIDEARSYRTWD